jgi:hypothetical protein
VIFIILMLFNFSYKFYRDKVLKMAIRLGIVTHEVSYKLSENVEGWLLQQRITDV